MMATGAKGWTAHHGQRPSCRLVVNPSSCTKPLGIPQQAAWPCPIESSSASKKWYRAPTHPFVAWRVVHGPLKAALRMSFDPIIRWQGVLTPNNPPRLGPGSVFSSLSRLPMHYIFMTVIGYLTKQRDIAFVLPLCFLQGQCTSLSFLVKSPQFHCTPDEMPASFCHSHPQKPSARDPSGWIPGALSQLSSRSYVFSAAYSEERALCK